MMNENREVVNGKECIDISGNFAAKTDDAQKLKIVYGASLGKLPKKYGEMIIAKN